MRWRWWQFRGKGRRLDFTPGGRWFLGFTLALGVAAIFSNNNVIYLLESLLLSALLFSGTLSELSLSRLRFTRELRQSTAGAETGDLLTLENTSWLPLYCVELGEYAGEELRLVNFVLLVPPRARLTLRSPQRHSTRGRHAWEGLFLATSFPFGFARKIRYLSGPGARLVWPAPRPAPSAARTLSQRVRAPEWATGEGELEPLPVGEDVARVHWPSSARAGELLRRPLRPEGNEAEVRLRVGGAGAEARIEEACFQLHQGSSTLVLEEKDGERRVRGKRGALDALALLPKEAS